MKKIQDLKPNEAVEIRTIKQGRKLLGWTNINLHLPVYIRYDRGIKYVTSIETPSTTVIYPALDFLPKKKKWKKEAFSEIARLDSEVNELRHILSKDMPVTVGEVVSINEPVRHEEKLIPESGKWYNVSYEHKDKLFGLIYVTEIKGVKVHHYGFHFDRTNIWTDKDWLVINLKYTHATPEEVKSALIKEAEKRGYKEGVTIKATGINKGLYCGTINGIFEFFEDSNILDSNAKGHIFDNGKWAEIVEQPKDIDWSVPGQLVVNEKGYVWLTTGEHDENNFKGVYIKHGKDNAFEIGMVSCECVKSAFKPHTDEPIILKP